jgi:hypothetical protein
LPVIFADSLADNAGPASAIEFPTGMNRMRYSVYAVEKGGKFLLKSDLRRFTPAPLPAIHFANYSRAAERAAKVGGRGGQNHRRTSRCLA